MIQQAEADTTPEAPNGTGIGRMRWPVRGRVVSGYGTGGGKANDGIDIAVPEGTPVKAAENGVVIYAGDGLKEFGNTVLVRHENGLVTVYGHASELKVNARREGQARPGDRPLGHERLRRHAEAALRGAQEFRAGRSVELPRVAARRPQSFRGWPSRPARSWMNCQATRPERPPRVVAHSSASARSASASIARS